MTKTDQSQLCVAINKLDTVDWDKARFDAIRNKLKVFLIKQAGFKEADISFIPCSGLTGENLTRAPSSGRGISCNIYVSVHLYNWSVQVYRADKE